MIISIHQPNYLPWIKFFHKVIHSDMYIVFDDVQLPRGKNYVLRNKIKTNENFKWLTVSVKNKNNMQPINRIKLNNETKWNEKHWNLIQQNYSKTNFFQEYKSGFEKIFTNTYDNLLELNLSLIKNILKILNANVKIQLSSDLEIKSTGTDKIIDIIKAVKGDEYHSGKGGGSERYVVGNEEIFKKNGINLQFQEFTHPVYTQLYGDFQEGMSIIDMIFNVGGKETYNILKSMK